MKKSTFNRLHLLIICVCSLFVMILFSACAGVAGTGTTTNGTTTIVGSIQSVNASTHSVVLTVSGQQYTISNLTDQQISALQSQVGKVYSIQVTNNNGIYTINTGTNPQQDDNGTPGINNDQPTGTNEPGKISYLGKVLNANSSSLTAALPNGQSLTMNLNAQTDQGDLNGAAVSTGQVLKVEATANTYGSFTATKLSLTDNGDLQNTTKLNTVDFKGVTTSAVGSDNVIHFNIGNKSFAYTINSSTELKNLANAQAIANNQPVKVEVLFNGSNANVIKVEVSNGQ
jgi:hypothetical protein